MGHSKSWVSRYQRLAPVGALSVEHVRFDLQKMVNPEISGAEHQQGELVGYEVREYLLQKWNLRCAYCGATNCPLNIDHREPRARGGSDRVSNLTLACVPCNQKKGAQPIEVLLAHQPQVLERVLACAKSSLMRAKQVRGFQTGDTVRAVVARGVHTGTWMGRVAVRVSGRFNLQTGSGVRQGIGWKCCRLLQRSDGYNYSTTKGGASSPCPKAGVSAPMIS